MFAVSSETASLDPLAPSLDWTLGGLLPGDGDTQLLRAVLHRGKGAVDAWHSFRKSIPLDSSCRDR